MWVSHVAPGRPSWEASSLTSQFFLRREKGRMVFLTLLPLSSSMSTSPSSVFGWDHVTQGLVDFGFILLDSYGPKKNLGSRATEITNNLSKTPAHKACSLGARILLETFKVRQRWRNQSYVLTAFLLVSRCALFPKRRFFSLSKLELHFTHLG